MSTEDRVTRVIPGQSLYAIDNLQYAQRKSAGEKKKGSSGNRVGDPCAVTA